MIALVLWSSCARPGPIAAAEVPEEGPPLSDTGGAPRGEDLLQPAEAVDLDADPAVLHVALTAADWQYNGQTPGPTLRARVGDTLVVDLTNALPAPTTIHWHGVHVPHAMDGAGWHHDPVPPGGTFQYRFTLDHPGTFWYHPHFDTEGQVDRGLYGVIVVEEPAQPVADVDQVWVFDIPDELADEAHGGHGFAFQPGPWTVNGRVAPVMRVAGGQVARVRLLNASNVGYLALSWPDLRVISGGQGLLSAPVTEGPLLLVPGQRAEVELRPGEAGFDVMTAPWTLAGESAIGDPVVLLRVEPEGTASPADPLPWPFMAEPPAPDPGYTDVVWTLSGDVDTGTWLINGEVWPEVGFTTVSLGSEVIVEVRNLSPTSHPYHLHGMPFEVLSVGGVAPAMRWVDDTVDVGIREALRIKVRADNPGEWMSHCHILPHAEGGMMTVLRVE